MMRFISEFLRYVEKYVDIKDERKKVYIRVICDELCKFFDDQFNFVLMKLKFGVIGLDLEVLESQKWKFRVVGLDLEVLGI